MPRQRRKPWTSATGSRGRRLDQLRDAAPAPSFKAERSRIQRHLLRLQQQGLVPDLRLAADSGEWVQATRCEPLSPYRNGAATIDAVVLALSAVGHQEACTVRHLHRQIREKAAELLGRRISPRQMSRVLARLAENGLLVCLIGPREGDEESQGQSVVPMYALTVPERLEDLLPGRTPGGRGRSLEERARQRRHRVREALRIEVQGDGQSSGVVEENGDLNPHTGVGVDSPLTPHVRTERRGRHKQFSMREGHRSWVRPPRPRRGEISETRMRHYRARMLAVGSMDHLELARVEFRALARLLAPFAEAGWSPADIRHALEHHPGGRKHINCDRVRHPVGWLRRRLELWRPQGTVLPSMSQRSAPGWSWAGLPAGPAGKCGCRHEAVMGQCFEYDHEPLEAGPEWENPQRAAEEEAHIAAEFQAVVRSQRALDEEQAMQRVEARMPVLQQVTAAFEQTRVALVEEWERRQAGPGPEDSLILRARQERQQRAADRSGLAALRKARQDKARRRKEMPAAQVLGVGHRTHESQVVAPVVVNEQTEAERLVDLRPDVPNGRSWTDS